MKPAIRPIAGVLAPLALVLGLACGSGNNPVSTSGQPVRPSTSANSTATVATNLPACPPSGSATSLTGAGSTFDAPLFAKQFDTYNQQCKIQVNYQSIGSGGGIEQFTKKTVNFGATDAPLTDEQAK